MSMLLFETYYEIVPKNKVEEHNYPSGTIETVIIDNPEIPAKEKKYITNFEFIDFGQYSVIIFKLLPFYAPDTIQKTFKVIKKLSSVTPEQIISKTRKGNIKTARHLFNFCLYALLKHWSLKEIGELTQRDHATVLHSVNVIRNIILTKDKKYLSLVLDTAKHLGFDSNNSLKTREKKL